MKVLLDTCVWGGTKASLLDAGYDTMWAGDWAEDPGDEEILAIAAREKRVLVTLDKDFGELVVVHEQPHCGVLRLVNVAARGQAPACLRVFAAHGGELEAGAIITVEPDRLRIRSPKDQGDE
jgi:predicted nuclease of predicted toxin-antitoxin system